MAMNKSIVTIYDLKNGGAPLIAHAIDAKEFLRHPSKRWSLSPTEQKSESAEPEKAKEESAKVSQLPLMSLRALQGMADKAGIDYKGMNKSELVSALGAKK